MFRKNPLQHGEHFYDGYREYTITSLKMILLNINLWMNICTEMRAFSQYQSTNRKKCLLTNKKAPFEGCFFYGCFCSALQRHIRNYRHTNHNFLILYGGNSYSIIECRILNKDIIREVGRCQILPKHENILIH